MYGFRTVAPLAGMPWTFKNCEGPQIFTLMACQSFIPETLISSALPLITKNREIPGSEKKKCSTHTQKVVWVSFLCWFPGSDSERSRSVPEVVCLHHSRGAPSLAPVSCNHPQANLPNVCPGGTHCPYYSDQETKVFFALEGDTIFTS